MAEETRSERVTIALTPTEYSRIEEAARLMSARDDFGITMSDVVRSGGLRRAEEILAGAGAASA